MLYPPFRKAIALLRSSLRALLSYIPVLICSLVTATAVGQNSDEPYVRFYAPKAYIYEKEQFPLTAELSNPSNNTYTIVRIELQFSELVELGGLDTRCGVSRPDNQTKIICTLTNVEPDAFYKFEFPVVGNLDNRPDFSVDISAGEFSPRGGDTTNFTVLSQDTNTTTLADGDPQIEGATLKIDVARHILFDSDGDGLGDISENIAGTSPFDRSSRPTDNATIDVTFLYSQAAQDYYRGKLGPLAESLLTVTNQLYLENNIAINLRLAAIGLLDYDENNVSVETVLDDLLATDSSTFSELENIRVGTGADLIVYFHLVDSSQTGSNCGIGSNVESSQGDFYREAHAGRLISVLNLGVGCAGVADLGVLLAINMGIAPNRIVEPNGGTFHFSAGFVTSDGIGTSENSINSSLPAEARFALSGRFSDPSRLCEFLPCGIDHRDLANGADTVLSLNTTRYVIANLTDSVLANSLSPKRPTIGRQENLDLVLRTSTEEDFGIKGTSIPIQAELINFGSETVHDVRVRFEPGSESVALSSDDNQCHVLASDLSTTDEENYSNPIPGDLICFIRRVAPGEPAGINFAAQVMADTAPELASELTLSAQVNLVSLSDVFCSPFYDNAVHALLATDPCPSAPPQSRSIRSTPTIESSAQLDPDQLPEVDGENLFVPYIRLDNGSLLSALFAIDLSTDPRLVLLDYQLLDSEFVANVESEFKEDSLLILRALPYTSDNTVLSASLLDNENEIVFGNILVSP